MPDQENNTYEKMARSTVDKIVEKHQKQKDKDTKFIENQEEYSRVLNGFFASDNGAVVAKVILRYLKVFTVDKGLNPAKKYEESIKRDVYLELIRPYLTPEVRAKIENLE